MKKKICCIYKIINTLDNKFYLGSTVDWKRREYQHRNNICSNIHLQNAIKKYGIENFVFEVFEIVENISILLEREQYYLDILKPWDKNVGYNVSQTAGTPLGYKHTEETKQKMSKKASGVNNPFFGKCHSSETKKILSIAMTGKKYSLERIEKIQGVNNPFFGKKHSVETKQIMSNKKRGKYVGEKSSSAKFSMVEVNKIREMYKTNEYSYNKLGQTFNVSKCCIRDIIKNKTYKQEKK